jgi:hypothetical protein
MTRSYFVPMRWMVIYEYEVPGGALNLKSTNHPDHGRQGDLPFQEKFPMAEPGIEPGTSWSVVTSPLDHVQTRTGHFSVPPEPSNRRFLRGMMDALEMSIDTLTDLHEKCSLFSILTKI